MKTRSWFAGFGFTPKGRFLMWPMLHMGLCILLFPGSGSGQWVLTAIHPDPTPAMGAPEAEFIALTAVNVGDSCASSDGWSLDWSGSPRFCAAGCWPSGTTLVAHRESDSVHFEFGTAVSMPMETWPALVNGGGTVLLRNAEGEVLDAMPYSSASLAGGGRPLMRADTHHCGAEVNQYLWEEGTSPYFAPQPQWIQEHPTLLAAFEEARAPERLVPRGAGKLDWYIGMTLNPVFLRSAEAHVGGMPASLQWRSDSVVAVQWDHRPVAAGDPLEDGIPISIGPLGGCFHGEETGQLNTVYQPVRSTGEVAVVGALADPVSSDPLMPLESIALLNRSEHPVGLGSWSFGGGLLRRQVVLLPGSSAWLNASDFEGWPGMANAGGAHTLTLPHGSEAAGLAWSPCDHDTPGLAGSGTPLLRSGVPGSAWHTAGGLVAVDHEPITIKGYGCRTSQWTGEVRLELFLNRYLDQLGATEWKIEGRQEQAWATAIPGRPDGVSLWWEGMANGLNSAAGVTVSVEHEGEESSHIVAHCPEGLSSSAAVPCLRIVELLWNASEDGDEFAEVQNCGTEPIDVSGLQATTESVPLPSDWSTWVSTEVSLVLAPGEVAAFGRCPKWMGAGLPEKGRSRWSAEQWGPLNDTGGSLKIRLPWPASEVLDEAEWGPHLEGPWWWTEDGWAWERSGAEGGDWSPAPGRGSPGAAPSGQKKHDDCGQVAAELPAVAGGLPALEWALPTAGATIVVNLIGWPSGELLERTVLEDVLSDGRWSWVGRLTGGRTPGPGTMLWDVRWWSGQCHGRQRIVVDVPGHG